MNHLHQNGVEVEMLWLKLRLIMNKIYDIHQIRKLRLPGTQAPSQKLIIKRRDEEFCDSANLIAEVMGVKCFYGKKIKRTNQL